MACASAALPAFFLTALAGVDNTYISKLNDALFVCEIRAYLVDEMLIGTYRDQVAAQLGKALAYMSTVIMTIWVAYQGFMIISGTNRKPILALGLQTGKMVLILSLVALVARQSPVIAETVLDFQALITAAIVGEGTDIYRTVDLNVGLALVFNALVDGLVGGQQSGADGKSMTTIAGMVGQAGPAMVISAYALAAEVFITLAIMLSPMFIFFLLFQQTAGKFWSWTRYLLGTMFSLAVLVLVGGVLLKMMMAYGAAVIAAFFVNGSVVSSLVSVDIAGSAMRMGMMGALSSALLLMIPPVIMGFFNSGASFAANALAGAVGGGGTAAMMQAMQKDGGAGGGAGGSAGASGNPALGHSGNTNDSGSVTGSAMFNRQIQQSIASKSATQGTGSIDGAFGTGPMLGSGARGLAAVEAGGGSPGLRLAQRQQQTQAANGELRENKATGIYETAETAQQLRQDSSLGTGGHLKVAEAAPAQGNALPRVQISDAQKMESANNLRAGESVSIGKADAPSTPVHAVPPPGVAQPGRPSMHGAAAAHQGHHPSPRPAVPVRGK